MSGYTITYGLYVCNELSINVVNLQDCRSASLFSFVGCYLYFWFGYPFSAKFKLNRGELTGISSFASI